MATVPMEVLKSEQVEQKGEVIVDSDAEYRALVQEVNGLERLVLILLLLGVVVFTIAMLVCLARGNTVLKCVRQSALSALLAVIAEGVLFVCLLYL